MPEPTSPFFVGLGPSLRDSALALVAPFSALLNGPQLFRRRWVGSVRSQSLAGTEESAGMWLFCFAKPPTNRAFHKLWLA